MQATVAAIVLSMTGMPTEAAARHSGHCSWPRMSWVDPGEWRNAALSIGAMPDFPMALTGVPTEELQQLLRLVHRSEVALPITPASLAFVGLLHRAAELMQSLRGLDEVDTRAVLVAVLAERMRS
jgi:hypothetical protein